MHSLKRHLFVLLVVISLGTPLRSFSYEPVAFVSLAAATEKIKEFFGGKPVVEPKRKIRIAVIAIQGMIRDESEWVKKLYALRNDSSVDAVLIKIDSGGGTPGAGQILSQEIGACSKKKPVVVMVPNICCSGGYWAAVRADLIIASEVATIGSIGVVCTISRKKTLKFKEFGGSSGNETVETFATSRNKTIFNEYGPDLTEADRVIIKNQLMHDYEIFYQDVARARNLNPEEHMKWGDAQVFSGRQAVTLGLIDRTGSYSDAIDALVKLVGSRCGADVDDEPYLFDY